MSCYDTEVLAMCFVPTDGSDTKQIREVHVFNSNGSPRAMYYLDPTDGTVLDPATDLSDGVIVICSGGNSGSVAVPTFDPLWEDGVFECQKLTLDNLTGVGPFTVTFDGVPVSGTPFSSEIAGRDASVDVVVTDALGQVSSQTFANVKNIASELWKEPNVLVTANTAYTTGASGSGGNDQVGVASGVSSTTSGVANGYVQYITNEIVRARHATATDPNRIWLDDNGGPITFDPLCEPEIEYSLRVRDVGTMESGDTLTAYLEWYDNTGALISDQQVDTRADDFGIITMPDPGAPGTVTPPAGASGVKVRFESVTNANNEWHYIYLSQNLTFLNIV